MIINTCQINLVYMVNGTKNKFFMCVRKINSW